MDRPPRLAWIDGYFTQAADEPVRTACRSALDTLTAAGAEVTTTKLPASFASVHEMHLRIMARGAARQHAAAWNRTLDRFGPRISELIQLGASISAAMLDEALAHQRQFRRDVEAAFPSTAADAWLMPAAPTTAPASLNSTGDPRFNSPWTYAGVPACTIPCGLDQATGMPVGLQLIGPTDADDRLLATAEWCERALKFSRPTLPIGEAP